MLTPEEKQNIKEYFRALLITQKRTIKVLEARTKELSELQEKVKYAESKPNIEIPTSAFDRVASLSEEVEQLKNELAAINLDIEKTKDDMKKADFGAGVDIDMLMAEFETLLGDDIEKYELEKKIEAVKVDDDLEKLKKKMGLN